MSARGEALPKSVQAAMGSALKFDFSGVRVHTDLAARESASSMKARAWTWGEHVVLGERANAQTLRHELAHVVQQSEARGGEGGQPAAVNDALEREASSVARNLHPPVLRAPKRVIQMEPETDGDRFRLKTPRIGERPPKNDGAFGPGKLEMQLLEGDRRHIDEYLATHGFHVERMDPVLDGSPVALDDIVDRVKPLLMPGVGADKVKQYVGAKIARLQIYALQHPKLGVSTIPTQLTLPLRPNDPVASGPKENHGAERDQGWQTVLAAGSQITWHLNVVTGKPASTPEDVVMQFQAARSYAAHPDKRSGSELQGMVQFGYNVTTHQYTIMSGAQYTEVFSLFQGLLQLGGFFQVLSGVALGGGSVSAQIQPSVGAQAVVQIGPLQLGAQVFRGLTITPGGESTQDTGGAFVLQWSF